MLDYPLLIGELRRPPVRRTAPVAELEEQHAAGVYSPQAGTP
jgi:hypothetical protein